LRINICENANEIINEGAGKQTRGCLDGAIASIDCDANSYEFSAQKLRQNVSSLDDLIERSRKAMESAPMKSLMAELESYNQITIVRAPLKKLPRIQQKIEKEYNGDCSKVRIIFLCLKKGRRQY